jgi:hypothetical protein
MITHTDEMQFAGLRFRCMIPSVDVHSNTNLPE